MVFKVISTIFILIIITFLLLCIFTREEDDEKLNIVVLTAVTMNIFILVSLWVI